MQSISSVHVYIWDNMQNLTPLLFPIALIPLS
uniref:Uncharacterized protein n=1 Tax=Arundo donax TaxID=35708 RepID=A0A0A9EBT3_ARUDO